VRLLAAILVGGALWGTVFGLWVGAPLVADAHSLVPRTLDDWIRFGAVMGVISAGLGIAISTFLAIPLVAWQAARRRPAREAEWTLVLSLGALLPLAWLLVAVIVELAFFGRMPLSRRPPAYAAAGVSAYLVAVAALVAVHRRIRAAARPPIGRLVGALVAAAVVGAVALPYRLPACLLRPQFVPA